jgi:hypothetical protein
MRKAAQLTVGALVLGSVIAADIQLQQRADELWVPEPLDDFDPTAPGPDWFGYWTFAQGVFDGVYPPLAQRARNYDCFGESMNFGSVMMDWNKAFRAHAFDGILNIAISSVTILADVYGLYRWYDICTAEIRYGWSNPFIAANQSTRLVGSVSEVNDPKTGYDGLYDTVYLLAILGNGYHAYTAFIDEGWLSYNFSKNTGAFATRLVMLIDKAGRLNILTPAKPWKIFN